MSDERIPVWFDSGDGSETTGCPDLHEVFMRRSDIEAVVDARIAESAPIGLIARSAALDMMAALLDGLGVELPPNVEGAIDRRMRENCSIARRDDGASFTGSPNRPPTPSARPCASRPKRIGRPPRRRPAAYAGARLRRAEGQ